MPLIASLGLVFLLFGIAFGIGNAGRVAVLKAITPRYVVVSTTKFGSTAVRILDPLWEDDFGSRIEVEVGGKLAYQSDMLHPSVGEVTLPGGESGSLRLLWIQSNSGGSGGYTDTYLFSGLDGAGASSFLPFAVLQNGVFTTRGEEGRVVWLQPDITYRYVWTSGAGSPVPTLDAIPTPAGLSFLDPPPGSGPKPSELEAIKARISSVPLDATAHGIVVAEVLQGFFNLVYAGRGAEAWGFFRECYRIGIARVEADPSFKEPPRSCEQWERELSDTMAKSPFWAEVLRINGGSLRPPLGN